MLLENKKILIMGIRNKWSIAYGIAKSAYENGAKLIFTYLDEESRPKLEALVEEFEGSKFYKLEDASEDEKVEESFKIIKENEGQIDGMVHAIAHAKTEDLANDFIYTSKDGYAHAMGVSAYSLILVSPKRKHRNINIPRIRKSNARLQRNGSSQSRSRSKRTLPSKRFRKRRNKS